MNAIRIDKDTPQEIRDKAVEFLKTITKMLESNNPTEGVYSMYVVTILVEGQGSA